MDGQVGGAHEKNWRLLHYGNLPRPYFRVQGRSPPGLYVHICSFACVRACMDACTPRRARAHTHTHTHTQALGNLFEYFLKRSGKRITVVGATSGDTGR
jgi:hypothetical protein